MLQEDVESEEEGDVFMDLSNMKETRDLEVCIYCAVYNMTKGMEMHCFGYPNIIILQTAYS